jgi:hypothetical protein
MDEVVGSIGISDKTGNAIGKNTEGITVITT